VRFNRELGGGALLDMGCYAIDIARMIFAAEPVEARATWRIDPVFDIDTDVAAILDFGEGRTALASCSFHGNGQGFYRVIGTHGVIDVPRGIIPGLDGRVGEAIITCIDEKGARRDEVIAPVDQYRLMAEAFADAVSAGRPTPYPPADSIRNMAALDAVAASACLSGTAVAIG
jgi:predicted dehydrogenase